MLLKSPVKHLCLFQFFSPVMTCSLFSSLDYSRGDIRQDSDSTMIDARAMGSALQDPHTSMSSSFYILVWMLQSFVFARNLTLLGLNVEWTWMFEITFSEPTGQFVEIYCQCQSPLHQISPSKVCECALQGSRALLSIPFIGAHKVGGYSEENVQFRRHRWLYLKACTII